MEDIRYSKVAELGGDSWFEYLWEQKGGNTTRTMAIKKILDCCQIRVGNAITTHMCRAILRQLPHTTDQGGMAFIPGIYAYITLGPCYPKGRIAQPGQ